MDTQPNIQQTVTLSALKLNWFKPKETNFQRLRCDSVVECVLSKQETPRATPST